MLFLACIGLIEGSALLIEFVGGRVIHDICWWGCCLLLFHSVLLLLVLSMEAVLCDRPRFVKCRAQSTFMVGN